MTVCIAAICDGGKSIVMAMDRMISTGYVSADVALKGVKVHRFWLGMYAGNNITRIDSIIDSVAVSLQSRDAPPTPGVAQVEDIFTASVQHETRSEAVAKILGVYGHTMETFLTKGREQFGDTVFADMKREIDDVTVDCQFLVAGFSPRTQPVDMEARLFAVIPPGTADSYTPVGFWSIGSGAHSALSSLMFHGHQASTPHGLGLYHVCEAKFMAESAMGVGKTTVVAVFKNDGSMGYLSQQNVARIRAVWEKKGKPRIPKGIGNEITSALTWVEHGKTIHDKPNKSVETKQDADETLHGSESS